MSLTTALRVSDLANPGVDGSVTRSLVLVCPTALGPRSGYRSERRGLSESRVKQNKKESRRVVWLVSGKLKPGGNSDCLQVAGLWGRRGRRPSRESASHQGRRAPGSPVTCHLRNRLKIYIGLFKCHRLPGPQKSLKLFFPISGPAGWEDFWFLWLEFLEAALFSLLQINFQLEIPS